MQLNTEAMVRNMQQQLEEKQKQVNNNDVKILKVLRRKTAQSLEDRDFVLGTEYLRQSYNDDNDLNDLPQPPH